MTGLADRLKARQLPRTVVHLQVEFGDAMDAAQAELAEAARDLRRHADRADADPFLVEQAQTRVATAQARVDEGFAEIPLRALPPAEFEELMLAFPPTEAQKARAKEAKQEAQFDPDALIPALLARCAEVDGMTVDDWSALVGKAGTVTSGEKAALFAAAMQINDRSPEVRLGKGSTPIRR